jgi:hypothetical protein
MKVSSITYIISIALVAVKPEVCLKEFSGTSFMNIANKISITKAQSMYDSEIYAREYIDELMSRDLEEYMRRNLLLQLSSRELATEMLACLECCSPDQQTGTCSICGMTTVSSLLVELGID